MPLDRHVFSCSGEINAAKLVFNMLKLYFKMFALFET